jgi:hypothetical protein
VQIPGSFFYPLSLDQMTAIYATKQFLNLHTSTLKMKLKLNNQKFVLQNIPPNLLSNEYRGIFPQG